VTRAEEAYYLHKCAKFKAAWMTMAASSSSAPTPAAPALVMPALVVAGDGDEDPTTAMAYLVYKHNCARAAAQVARCRGSYLGPTYEAYVGAWLFS